MITPEQLAELAQSHGDRNHCYQTDKQYDKWVSLNELVSTLSAALKCLEEIKKIHKGPLIDGDYYAAIDKALEPFNEGK